MKINRGILAALAAATLFGLSTPIAKILVVEISPLMLAGFLYLGSGVGLGIVVTARALVPGRSNLVWPRGADFLWLVAAIGFGGVLGPYLLMYGLQMTDSATGSLFLNLEAVFTALLAWFAFNENFDHRIAAGLGLMVAGGLILSLNSESRAGGILGPIAIVGACLAWAVDNNLTRKVSSNDAMLLACLKGLIAGSVCVALAMRYGARMPGGALVLRTALVGFLGYGLSLTLFVLALRDLGAARTGAYFSLAPFIGATLAVILGAPLTPALIGAGILIAIGLWLHLTEQHAHRHEHQALRHEHSHVHDLHHQHTHSHEDEREPHSHVHTHEPIKHTHAHYPDIHHRHGH